MVSPLSFGRNRIPRQKRWGSAARGTPVDGGRLDGNVSAWHCSDTGGHFGSDDHLCDGWHHGLTTLRVANSSQTITGVINATGCDMGIYVPPCATNVNIHHVTIAGAKDHAIFIENASKVVIKNSIIMNHGAGAVTCPHGQPNAKDRISENKPIELVGTIDSTISGNIVEHNTSDGGIGIADHGKVDPGALRPGVARAMYGNVVENNIIVDNAHGPAS